MERKIFYGNIMVDCMSIVCMFGKLFFFGEYIVLLGSIVLVLFLFYFFGEWVIGFVLLSYDLLFFVVYFYFLD